MINQKITHRKNCSFDFKLIDLVEPHQILYNRTLNCSSYAAKKRRQEIWYQIANEMNVHVSDCIKRWENIRCTFQKQWKNSLRLCPAEGIIRESSWPYMQRLKFLEAHIQGPRMRIVRVRMTRKVTKESKYYKKNEKEEHAHIMVVENMQTSMTSVNTVKKKLSRNETAIVNIKEEENAVPGFDRIKSMIKNLSGLEKERAKIRILAYLYKVRTLSANNLCIANVQI